MQRENKNQTLRLARRHIVHLIPNVSIYAEEPMRQIQYSIVQIQIPHDALHVVMGDRLLLVLVFLTRLLVFTPGLHSILRRVRTFDRFISMVLCLCCRWEFFPVDDTNNVFRLNASDLAMSRT